MMDIKPIRNDRDYRRALAEIGNLMDAEDDTPEADRLDVLATLVEAYEDKHWPIEAPDPVAAIEHTLEFRGLPRSALIPLIGSRARVSEVLNRKRHLTLPMIWRLVRELGIPAEVLVRPYDLGRTSRPKRRAAAAAKKPTRKRAPQPPLPRSGRGPG
jgi:HTH-type transcriptional regulator / antitoxin HigA